MEHVMDARFAATDAKLLRVEGIVDARLSRIEQELKIR